MEGENLQRITDYIQKEKILIVEPSVAFQKVLATCFLELGASPENIIHSKRYGDAFNALFKYKPRILLSEFFIEDRQGLALIDIQSQFYDDSKKIAILATHNASDSAVAEAAEGHVDDYLLKPYPMERLKNRLASVVLKKITPTPYLKKINDGKTFLGQREFDKAAREFNEAASIHDSPALAFYYGGYTQFLQSQFDAALSAYRKSQSIQTMHYKSLMGEFDTLYELKKYRSAYEMVPVIRKFFPISSHRLGKIVITAIYAGHFKEMKELFDIYASLESPSAELIKIFSAAFMTTGKYYVKNNHASEARQSFERGLGILGADASYINRAARELLKIRAAEDARLLMQRFPSDQVGGKVYSQLKFLVDQYFDDTHEHIEKGRKLVAKGYADADCFRLLLHILVDMNKRLLAESIAEKAADSFPEMREEVYRLIAEKFDSNQS